MSATVAQTIIKITALDQASQKFAQISANVRRTERAIMGTQRRIKASMGGITAMGAGMSAAVTLPFTMATRDLFGFGVGLSRVENQLKAVSDATPDSMAAMQAAIKSTAADTIFDLTEITKAATSLARTGLNADQIIGVLDPIAKTATASGESIDFLADKMTNIGMAMGLDMSGVDSARASMAGLADQMTFTAHTSNNSMSQIAEAMKPMAPLVRAMGGDAEDTLAILAALGDSGIQGSEAGTAMKTIIARLMAPTKQARSAMAAAGLNMGKFFTGGADLSASGLVDSITAAGMASTAQIENLRGRFGAIIADASTSTGEKVTSLTDSLIERLDLKGDDAGKLGEVVAAYVSGQGGGFDFMGALSAMNRAGLSATQIEKIAGKHHYAKLLALFGDFQKVEQKIAAFDAGHHVGSVAKAASVMMEDLSGSFERFRATLSTFKDSVLTAGVGQFFIDTMDNARRLIGVFNALPSSVQMSIVKFGTLAAVMGPALIAFGALGRLAMFGLAPIVSLTGGIARLVLAIRPLAMVAALLSPVGLALAGIAAAGYSLFGWVSQLEVVQAPFERVGKGWDVFTAGFNEFRGDLAVKGLKIMADGIRSTAKAIWDESDTKGWLEGKLTRLNAAVVKVSGSFGEWALKHVAMRAALTGLGSVLSKVLAPIGKLISVMARPFLFAVRLASAATAAHGLRGAIGALAKSAGTVLAPVLARVSRLFARMFLSKSAIAMTALVEVALALAQNMDKVGEAFGKIGKGDLTGGLTDLYNTIKESFSTEAMALIGVGLGYQIIKGLARGAWKRTGLLAGAMFSGGFKLATAGLGMLRGMFKGMGTKVKGLGNAAAGGFGILSIFSGIGGKVKGALGKSIGKVGLGKFIMKGIGKLLFRAVPYVGWGLLALDVVNLIKWAFGDQLKALGGWMKEKFTGIWESVLEASTIIAEGARNFGRDLFTFFTATVPGWINATGKWFGRQWSAAVTLAVSVGEWISKAVKSLLKSIKAFFVGGFADALDIGIDLTDAVVGKFTALGESIGKAMSKPIDNTFAFLKKGGVLGAGWRWLTGEPEEGKPAPAVPGAPVSGPTGGGTTGLYNQFRGGGAEFYEAPSIDQLTPITFKPLGDISDYLRSAPDMGQIGKAAAASADSAIRSLSKASLLIEPPVTATAMTELSPLATAQTFAQSGIDADMVSPSGRRDEAILQAINGLTSVIAANGVKLDGKANVEVTIKSAPGVVTAAMGRSKGDMRVNINTGRDELSS